MTTIARIHQKTKKKLPRRERIAKLTASRFSSAIIEKGAEHSERNRINEKKEAVAETEAKRQQRDAAFAQQSKRQGKRPRAYCIPEELEEKEEEKAAAAAEESVRPSTTLGRPKGQTSLAH